MYDDLTKFAVLHGTDKFGYHDYTPVYHGLLQRFRDRPVRLLEIGVGGYGSEDQGGESLATWRDYFPQGRIVGIDIAKKALDLGPRVRIAEGSQVDEAFLSRIVAEEGPFDIILDDGSHRNEHVVATFALLFPTLAAGGIYIVEDLQTAFFPRFGGSSDLTQPNSVGFFAALIERLLGGQDVPAIAGVPAEGLVGMERFHNIVVLHKAAGNDAVAPPPGWLPAPGAQHGASALRERDAALTPAALEAAFGALAEGEALLLRRAGGAVDAALRGFLTERFVELDHVERAVHFPDAARHPMAGTLRAMAASAGSLALWKAENTYPSNFAYDLDHPRVAAAVARMREILAEAEAGPGGLSFAAMLTRFGREAEALSLVERYDRAAPQSRRYYELAVMLLRRAGREAEALPLLEAAVRLYPGDPVQAATLAAHLVRIRDYGRASAVLDEAIARSPRARALHSQMARARLAKGDFDGAAASARTAISLTPRTARLPMNTLLGQILLRKGDLAAAAAHLAELAAEAPENDRVLRLVSEVLLRQGDRAGALEAIDKALRLSPEAPDLLRRREALASR